MYISMLLKYPEVMITVSFLMLVFLTIVDCSVSNLCWICYNGDRHLMVVVCAKQVLARCSFKAVAFDLG